MPPSSSPRAEAHRRDLGRPAKHRWTAFLSGFAISHAAAAFTVAVQAPRIGFGLGVRIANVLEYLDAVWSFGYLVGSAVALMVCSSRDLTVEVGFQVEATLRFLAGPIKATSARVTLLSSDLAKGGTPGCPSV